jgi:hypothetical protein
MDNPAGWFSVGSNLKQPSQKTHQRAVLKWHPDRLAAIDQVYLFAELIFVCWNQECGISRNKFFSDFGFGHLVCPRLDMIWFASLVAVLARRSTGGADIA